MISNGIPQSFAMPSDWTSPRAALTRRRVMPKLPPNVQQTTPNVLYPQMSSGRLIGWQQPWVDQVVMQPSVTSLAPITAIQVRIQLIINILYLPFGFLARDFGN